MEEINTIKARWNSLTESVVELYLQSRYNDAIADAHEALRLAEAVFGSNDLNTGTSMINLADIYLAMGKYDVAEILYKRTLAISESARSPEHPEVAQILNNLALLYDLQGNHVEAESLYKKTLVLIEKAFGRDHIYVAGVMSNLAELYKDFGSYAEAGPLFERALAIREKSLESDHPEVQNS